MGFEKLVEVFGADALIEADLFPISVKYLTLADMTSKEILPEVTQGLRGGVLKSLHLNWTQFVHPRSSNLYINRVIILILMARDLVGKINANQVIRVPLCWRLSTQLRYGRYHFRTIGTSSPSGRSNITP